MAVHAPGPRLYSSIPFHHLAQKGHGHAKGLNVALNITPFVDMMTILVCFLLMVFSASGELLTAQKGLTLPDATVKKELRQAPVIVITRDEVSLNGHRMATVEELESNESMEWKIPALFEDLRRRKQDFQLQLRNGQLDPTEKQRCRNADKKVEDPKEWCLDGLVILQADKGTKSKVLNRVLKTAYAAEFKRIMFAVNKRGGPAGDMHE